MRFLRFLAVFITATTLYAIAQQPEVRPSEWAQPVINSTLGNCYRVSDELFRSEQPKKADLPDLKALGIHTIINLREYHDDPNLFGQSGLTLLQHEMDSGSVSVSDLVTVLKQFRSAKKAVLIHCRHGSDRTGFIVAGYRIVFQNWTKEAAIKELSLGGYGFHELIYPNIIKTLQDMDVPAVKKAVFE